MSAGFHLADRLLAPLLERLAGAQRRPFVFGLCGAQGCGKSTVAQVLRRRLEQAGVAAATLSLDDLYLCGAARARLAREVHPLLRTRGPPGTHDLALAWAVIAAAAQVGPFALPRFDKAVDEPFPPEAWPVAQGPLQVLLLEGWCVGAAPEPPQRLVEPVNDLERREDADGRWRAWVNAQLASDYQRLFARIDMLALIAAPGMHVVGAWRREQEDDLRRALAERHLPTEGAMSDAAIDRFVQFFERITLHALAEMPARADVVIRLDAQRRIVDEPPR